MLFALVHVTKLLTITINYLDEDDEDELGLSQEPKVTLQNDVSQLR